MCDSQTTGLVVERKSKIIQTSKAISIKGLPFDIIGGGGVKDKLPPLPPRISNGVSPL